MQGRKKKTLQKAITNTLREIRENIPSIMNGMLLKKEIFKTTKKELLSVIELSSYRLKIDCYKMFWVSSIVIIKKIPIEDTQKKMRKEKSTSLPKIH